MSLDLLCVAFPILPASLLKKSFTAVPRPCIVSVHQCSVYLAQAFLRGFGWETFVLTYALYVSYALQMYQLIALLSWCILPTKNQTNRAILLIFLLAVFHFSQPQPCTHLGIITCSVMCAFGNVELLTKVFQWIAAKVINLAGCLKRTVPYELRQM